MTALADLIPQLVWALSVAAHVYLVLEHATHKETVMSDLPDAPIATAANLITGDAGSTFAANNVPAAPPVATVHPAVQAVVTGVQATQPPHNWAMTAATVLQNLMPIIQPAEEISRASTRTQGTIAIGVAGLAAILSAFFPHPNA